MEPFPSCIEHRPLDARQADGPLLKSTHQHVKLSNAHGPQKPPTRSVTLHKLLLLHVMSWPAPAWQLSWPPARGSIKACVLTTHQYTTTTLPGPLVILLRHRMPPSGPTPCGAPALCQCTQPLILLLLLQWLGHLTHSTALSPIGVVKSKRKQPLKKQRAR